MIEGRWRGLQAEGEGEGGIWKRNKLLITQILPHHHLKIEEISIMVRVILDIKKVFKKSRFCRKFVISKAWENMTDVSIN